MRRVVVMGFALALASFGIGCRPLLDGGWEGEAQCNNDVLPLSAIFNEDGEGDLEGTVYIEGIFGGLIAKGTIEGGGYDPEADSFDFRLQTDDDEPAEFDIELEYAESDTDQLEGSAEILNDSGEAQDQCDVELERVTIPD